MSVEAEYARLAPLRLNALRAAWRSRFNEEPPAYASRELLLLAFTYRLECEAKRDLSPSAKKRLTEFSQRFADNPDYSPTPRAIPSIGSALVRDWNGVRHVVLVTPEGFQYLERTYGSLTQVARAITGQHRSGPHFFDLPKSKPPPPRSPTKTLVKLCIVGHDEALIASLQAQLREAGHAVAVAYNNNAGLHRLGADIFDALFVGQTCAVIGSTSVIPWIRKLYPDLWIVVLCKISKAAELELSAEVQELGADRCLNQPFSEAELQALLLEIAAKRR